MAEIDHFEILKRAKALFVLNKKEKDTKKNLQEVRLEWGEFNSIKKSLPSPEKNSLKSEEAQLIQKIEGHISQSQTLAEAFGNRALLVDLAETVGLISAYKGASTQQMRTFLDAVKEPQYSRDPVLLKPHLAYALSRGKEQLEPFAAILFACLDKFDAGGDDADLESLRKFTEAIYAYYYRYKGGK